MKPFSIIITGAIDPRCWYANRIGETLKVLLIDLEENYIEVDVSHLEMNRSGRAWVHLDDCELVHPERETK